MIKTQVETGITKEKFEAYLSVQQSGITNMFDVRAVISLSGNSLTKEDCLDIMKNYANYKKQFNLEDSE